MKYTKTFVNFRGTVLRNFTSALLPIFILIAAMHVGAQSSKELFVTSMGSIPTGPTAAAQTAQLLLNTDNPTGNTIGASNAAVTVTATVSNQQYTGVGTGTGNPVVMLGATANNVTTAPASQAVYRPMNVIGGPVDGNFSNTPSGSAQGMFVAVNHAFNMFTAVRQWTNVSTDPPSNSRVYMADLTVSFSSPVTNPVLHFVGLGGTSATMTFSSEFNLTTPGLTLTKLQGNAALVVTATQINNGNATGIGATCSTNIAGCGTVRVNGSNISTITFQVFVRGAGPITSSWNNGSTYPGDQWMLGVSLPEAYNVSGNVYQDPNGLGDGTVNGTGIGSAGASQLYANLIDPSDNSVIGSVPVAANGAYTFTGLPGGGVNHRVDISINQGVALAAAPARALPASWQYLGENLGAGAGSDGTPNGSLNVTVGSAALANANFGTNIFLSAPVGVAGRVLLPNGRPGKGVWVSIQNASTGQTLTMRTGTFGYFAFDNLTLGDFYILTATDKRSRRQTTRALQLMEYVDGLTLALEPQEAEPVRFGEALPIEGSPLPKGMEMP